MPLKVKICGLTTLADARYCAGAGADFLGFIQYPQSPRYVEPKAAKEILEWVYGPESVGVFVDDTPDQINEIADEVNFSMIQLHGNESPDFCAAIDRPLIKAFRVGEKDTAGLLRKQMEPYREWVAYYLLDTYNPQMAGGTGEVFNWDIARDLATDFPILLAGGIGPDNVEDAVRTVNPAGIDLSSRVESNPGVKDFDKLTAFFDTFNSFRESYNAAS